MFIASEGCIRFDTLSLSKLIVANEAPSRIAVFNSFIAFLSNVTVTFEDVFRSFSLSLGNHFGFL